MLIFVGNIDFCGKWIFDEEKWITILKLSHREFIFFPDPARRETVDSLKDIPVGLFYHYKKCESSIFRRKKSWPFEKVKKLCVFGHLIFGTKICFFDEKVKLPGGPGEQTCVSIDGETPCPEPPPYLPPRIFLPRACSSFPTGLGQRPSRGKEKKEKKEKKDNINTIAFSRGPVPPSRPGVFVNPFGHPPVSDVQNHIYI